MKQLVHQDNGSTKETVLLCAVRKKMSNKTNNKTSEKTRVLLYSVLKRAIK